MKVESRPVNLNSAVIEKAAKEAGLPVPEFVEMCTLAMICIRQLSPNIYTETGKTAMERLDNLRFAIEMNEISKKLTPENKKLIREQFPEFKPFNQEE
ncbi:MAG: hypothetical protein K9M45_12865 [Kiritimatiellales bacterium]|nr:hypothetical protein [Kiritimatiellales bacterium]